MTLTYNGYERDGKMPTYGSYSTRITVDEAYVLRIPQGLPLVGPTNQSFVFCWTAQALLISLQLTSRMAWVNIPIEASKR